MRIEEHIADLHKRIDRLETGGKPITGISGAATGNFTLPGGSSVRFSINLVWSDATITEQPHGKLYFELYVDNDRDDDYRWGWSSTVSSTDHRVIYYPSEVLLSTNQTENNVIMRVYNETASSHTYYIHTLWTFNKGASGSSA